MNIIAPQHLISLLSHCKTLVTVKQIHVSLVKTGAVADPFIAGKLILHCAVTISDALSYARRIFLHFPHPDVFMYNTLVRGYSESDSPEVSIATFVEMRRKLSFSPDSFSFAFTLKSAANFRSLKTGTQLHCLAFFHGLHTHIFVATTLISMYGECGCVEFARKVFDEMPEPNVVAWNALITACFRGNDVVGAKKTFESMPVKNLTSWNVMLAGYAKTGELEPAKRLFVEMPVKDGISWSTMIVGFAHNGLFNDAFECFRELQRLGMGTSEVSLTGVLSACAQAGAFEFGRILHGFIEKLGLNWIVSVNNAFIDTYSKCGNEAMARSVFENMTNKTSIVSWTSMLNGLAMQGHGEEAIELFRDMVKHGIRPDEISFISLLYACSHTGLVDEGEEYFSAMKEVYGIEPAIEHYGCMVDLYGRAGKLESAYDFVCRMPIQPNAIIWRTLLGACSIHGDIKLAERVKMRVSELDPDHSGDHVLLSNVYAVAGKWRDVASTRRSMADQKIKKTPGWSLVEVDKQMYSFTAVGKRNKINDEAYEKLNEIILRIRVEAGYVPEIRSSLHDIEEEEKEDQVTKHSEKLAVAFAIARTPKGGIIRVVKNLRICRDCHSVMKMVSRVYGLEIVIRDRSRFHSFKNGSCTCRDYW